MDEFALIRRHFAGLTPGRPEVSLSIGDDCALLTPPAGHELAITTDTLIAGRHFPDATEAFDIGWKALAVNLSDLAAMGAQPLAFLLALTLPAELDGAASRDWLVAFASGMRTLAAESNVALIGGDTTRGRLSITITALGCVPARSALRRTGAEVGDLVCVTGTLGDAALALQRLEIATTDGDALRLRLDRPTPRLSAGFALRGLAHAAIDLSDGLAGDLQHVLDASGVGAEIDAERLPMSPEFARLHSPDSRLELQAAGGDDYELCICLPPSKLAEARARLDIPLTGIGRIVAGSELYWQDADGRPIDGPKHGYRHF
jgi:thiamine-monophosphate kinase